MVRVAAACLYPSRPDAGHGHIWESHRMDVPFHAGQPQDALLRRLYGGHGSLPLSFERVPREGADRARRTTGALRSAPSHGRERLFGDYWSRRRDTGLTIESAT